MTTAQDKWVAGRVNGLDAPALKPGDKVWYDTGHNVHPATVVKNHDTGQGLVYLSIEYTPYGETLVDYVPALTLSYRKDTE